MRRPQYPCFSISQFYFYTSLQFNYDNIMLVLSEVHSFGVLLHQAGIRYRDLSELCFEDE